MSNFKSQPKLVKSKVITIIPSTWDLTQQGNPRTYWYILECGHIMTESHSARVAIQGFCRELNVPVIRNCRKCQYGKAVDLKLLKDIMDWITIKHMNNDVPEFIKTWLPRIEWLKVNEK